MFRKLVKNRKIGNKTGILGEKIACEFLVKQNYEILEKNYLKKWGEIDIVAKKDDILCFVEVKTQQINLQDVTQETLENLNPEENVHSKKIKRLSRVIQTYLDEKKVTQETSWQFDIVAVFLDKQNKLAKVRYTEDIVL